MDKPISYRTESPTAPASTLPTTEDDFEETKIKASLAQLERKMAYMTSSIRPGTLAADGAQYKPKPQVGDVPPSHYRCHRCGQGGHYIKFCPTNGNGEPMVTKGKKAAVPIAQRNQFLAPVMDTPVAMMPFPSSITVPSHLTCGICHELLGSVMTISCCSTNFCSTCITERLSEDFICPICHESDRTIEDLVPNPKLQQLVTDFGKRSKYTRPPPKEEIKRPLISKPELPQAMPQFTHRPPAPIVPYPLPKEGTPQYVHVRGYEAPLILPPRTRQMWAVASGMFVHKRRKYSFVKNAGTPTCGNCAKDGHTSDQCSGNSVESSHYDPAENWSIDLEQPAAKRQKIE